MTVRRWVLYNRPMQRISRDADLIRPCAILPWVVGAVLGINVEFFTLLEIKNMKKLVYTFMT